MNNEKLPLHLVSDVFYWSMLYLNQHYGFSQQELTTALKRHLDAVEQLGEKQIMGAGSYRRADEVVTSGWEQYLKEIDNE